jgi:succinoglycan biosynthesis protein ExoA
VAMRNESRYIERCIKSILNQDYPPDHLEVLVLDGRSEDDSLAIVSRLVANRGNYNLLENPDIYQACAWNLGILQSRGEIIGIVSGHCELAPDYVTQLVETLQRTQADMVGGPTTPVSEGWVAEAIALALSSPFGVGDAQFHYTRKEIPVDSVFMGTCPRQVYESIGGFDAEMVRNQDDEFSYRLRENGGKIICNPSIRSRYYNRTSLGSLWKQYFQYGFWKVRVLQKHPNQMRYRQFTPPTFVLALLASCVLAFFPIARPFSIIIPLLYLCANLLAAINSSRKSGWNFLPLLPIIYSILHLSYGTGFLVGLVKFSGRWGDRIGKVPFVKITK